MDLEKNAREASIGTVGDVADTFVRSVAISIYVFIIERHLEIAICCLPPSLSYMRKLNGMVARVSNGLQKPTAA